MWNLGRVKCTLLLLCAISAASVSCDDALERSNTKTVGFQDPSVDATVKAALENGSVSEVVVRKDLLLFPVNAPNLVIAHSQEIHAVPQKNGSVTSDGKPTAAEVAEVNEYSLSQLVSTNDTDEDNGTESQSIAIPASSFPSGSENDSVLEPGKFLEIVSGFNLSNGVATDKVSLPSEVQNFSIPKQSIVDLLSKSLPQPDASITTTTEPMSYYVAKRSVDSDEDADDDDDSSNSKSEEDNISSSTTESDSSSNSSSTKTVKRSVDSEEDDDDDSKFNSTKVVKRFADSGDDNNDDDESTTNSMIDGDHAVKNSENIVSSSTTASSLKIQNHKLSGEDEFLNDIGNEQESLREDSGDDMEVAEDIVFRPLFRYRQETRLRQQYPSYRSGYSKPAYNHYDSDYSNQYRYKADNSDYD